MIRKEKKRNWKEIRWRVKTCSSCFFFFPSQIGFFRSLIVFFVAPSFGIWLNHNICLVYNHDLSWPFSIPWLCVQEVFPCLRSKRHFDWISSLPRFILCFRTRNEIEMTPEKDAKCHFQSPKKDERGTRNERIQRMEKRYLSEMERDEIVLKHFKEWAK